MSAKQEENAVGDKLKLFAAFAVLVASIVFYYSYAEDSVLVGVGGILIGIGLACFVALQSNRGKRVWLFAQEARTEVRKVVWPTRAETIQTTLTVIVMVFIVSLMLWLIDMFLFWIVKFMTGQGG